MLPKHSDFVPKIFWVLTSLLQLCLFFKLRPFCRIVYPYLQLMGTKLQNKQHTSKLRTWYLLWKQPFLNTRNLESLLWVEKHQLKDSSILSNCLLYPGKLIKPAHLWNTILAWNHRLQNLTVTHDLLNKRSQRQLTHGMGIRGEKSPEGTKGVNKIMMDERKKPLAIFAVLCNLLEKKNIWMTENYTLCFPSHKT